MQKKVKIVGAGLAGSEAAWKIANAGFAVDLYEMRPKTETKAHKTDKCAELVCSNSLKSSEFTNAAGLLKKEMELMDSLTMEAAAASKLPAGAALAVDRVVFSKYVDDKIKNHPNINFITQETDSIPDFSRQEPLIIASGPLTSRKLTESIEQLLDSENLAFFDAIAPIFFAETLDLELLFKMSRYNKGSADYLNIPLEKDDYYQFIEAVSNAEKYTGNEAVENDSPDKLRAFEGCMPIEDIIERGPETIRFGPMKPKGLPNPRTGKEPYAAIQLRQDDQAGHSWSMVGMQTRLKRHEQEKIFRALPGLSKAEFVRYGSFHRNTFIDSPRCLKSTLECIKHPGLFFAGQITGTEGYIESAVGGIITGINCTQILKQEEPLSFPIETATGSLFHYISDPERKDFQPMNITYGIMPSYHALLENGKKMPKKQKRERCSENAYECMKNFLDKKGAVSAN